MDSSIYGALVRLSQPWVMRYPLLDFHGNMGNIGGDGPAAYRYTEVRLNKLSEQGMLAGLKTHNVDFIPNYDETTEEPITLPAIFPNLLCNPNAGIGVALRCSWAPHNLVEVAAAINQYLQGNEPILPGPDFPTGGIVINKDDIPGIMKTGRGTVKIRAKYHIEKQNIIFTEIPYGVTTEDLLTQIGESEIEGIKEARNESGKKGLRITVECDRSINPETIVAKLFAKTDLQSSFSYNQVGLIDKTPVELNLKDCIEIYVNHNIECIIKEYNFHYQQVCERLEIVEGLLKALEDIDNIISLIKTSESSAVARVKLIDKYKFTEAQAKSILAMRLSSLAKLEAIELQNEHTSLINQKDEILIILNNKDKQIELIQSRLADIVTRFGDSRRTELMQLSIPKEDKEIAEVIPEDVVVVVTQSGVAKRVPRAAFKTQKRKGKGVKSLDEAVLETIKTNTIDTLMIFTDCGRMYRVLVDKIPVGTNTSGGQPLWNLVKISPDEKITAVTSLHRDTNAEYVVFFTKNGLVKKTLISELIQGKRNTGSQVIKFKEDNDKVIAVTFVKDENLLLITKHGYAIHFNSADINIQGRVAAGVKAIKLEEEDEVVVGLPTKTNKSIAILSSIGNGKLLSVSEFPFQNRGGRGVLIHKNWTSNDYIASAALVDETDEILVVGEPNSIRFAVKDLPRTSRTATGNLVITGSKVKRTVKL